MSDPLAAAPRASKPKLLFLHIPKAAGTTFDTIVRRQAAPRATFGLDLNDGQISLAAYKQLPAVERERYWLVTGHMPFGLHPHVPGSSTYITLLRDPVDRVVSYYYFVLASPQHYLYARVKREQIGLRDFVAQGLSTELDNGQTRLLAADEAKPLPHGFGELTPDLVDTAMRNLEQHFSVAGLAEQFNATLLLLRARLGWALPSLMYVHQNRTANRPTLQAVAPEVLEVIRQHQAYDLALYDFARQRFERALTEAVPDTTRQTHRLENWLQWYTPAYLLYRRARRAIPKPFKQPYRRWRATQTQRGG